MIGKTISHYKIIEKLGEGGMGVVYKAEDTKLKRTVALKFLPPELTRDEETKKRFIHEAQTASAFEHTNICNIHEIDQTEDGQLFISMAYYDGESLKKKIEGERLLAIEEILDIAIQIAQGLTIAHESNIIHRDLKPANIMITDRGEVKIVDFGLAKLAGQTKLTKEGTTLGTVAYMSPEQVRGEEVDHRSDIWQLGVVLYEMISGQLPFKGEYEQAVVYSIMNEEPEPPTALRSGVPMELERIISKTLVKNLDERYQHTDELITDLKKLKKDIELEKKSPPTTRAKDKENQILKSIWEKPVYILVGFISIIILIFALKWIFEQTTEKPLEKSIAVLPFATITKSEEDEIFSEGIHDDILTQLAKIRDLKVIARTSVMRYKNTEKRISEIGEELGVSSVLEGSVRRTGGRIRIVSQLIDVKTDGHLWAETYDRDFTDIFAIQSDVAQKIATALKATLTPQEKSYIEEKPTDNMEAYDYFLKGKHFWNTKVTREGNQKAAEFLEKAAELDPNFTLAYAWASITHSALYSRLSWDHTLARKELAKSALNKALALDPDHPIVHYAKGYYQEVCLKDYNFAIREYEIAFKGEPNNSEIAQFLGEIYMRSGNWKKAEETLLKAYILNPLGINSAMRVGRFYLHQRQFDKTQYYYTLAIQSDPEQPHYYRRKGNNYLDGFGDIKKARSLLKEAEMNVSNPEVNLLSAQFRTEIFARDFSKALSYAKERKKINSNVLSVGQAYYYLGEEKLAQEEFVSMRVYYENKIEEEPEYASFHSNLGLTYAYLGLKEKAIEEGRKGTELLPVAKDHVDGTRRVLSLAIIYILTGENELALDKLDYLLSIPGYLTKWTLRLDPVFDPLRDNLRFQKLINKKG